MSGVISLIQQDNWHLFLEINGMAGRHALLDTLMVMSASDLIFLMPLLLLAFWFAVARFSPVLSVLGLAGPTRLGARRLAQEMALIGCAAVAFALAFNLALAHLVYEPRPFISHPQADHLLMSYSADASFPSDHTAVAFAVATTLCLYLELAVASWVRSVAQSRLGELGDVVMGSRVPLGAPALLAGVALLAAVTIGFARVYVGVHYPGDIAGGAACGFVAASLLVILRPRLEPVLDGIIGLAERLRLA